MGYIANVPLRVGHKRIQPGERVPVERGRSYLSMIRLGQITVVRDDLQQGSETEQGAVEMEWFTRSALNELATRVGVEDPEKFPNKAALIAAIREQHSGDSDDDE